MTESNFGTIILIIIIIVGWSILKPRKRAYRQKNNFWQKYGYNADRDNPEYQKWRKKVRDKSKGCIVCGTYNDLHCHHIVPWSVSKWKRYRVSNGCTMCEVCHMKYHNEYSLNECNKRTLNKFIKKYRK